MDSGFDLWARIALSVLFVFWGCKELRNWRRPVLLQVHVPRVAGNDELEDRLRRVYERRQAEWQPMNSAPWGFFYLALAAAALANVPLLTILAIGNLWVAVLVARRHFRRGIVARRAARLSQRRLFSVLPWYVFVVALAAAVSPLASVGSSPVTSIVVSVGSLTALWFSWRVATLSADSAGDDPRVELFVDTRVRRERTVDVMMMATTAPLFFAWMGPGGVHQIWQLHAVAMVATFGLQLYLARQLMRFGRAVQPSDVVGSAHG